MSYGPRKYKIESGPRGWVLSEYLYDYLDGQTVDTAKKVELWAELGKYETKEKALDALQLVTSRKEVLYFNEKGEAV